MTWAEYWPRYLDDFSRVHHRPKTTELHAYCSKRILEFMGDDPLEATDDLKLDRFAAELAKAGLKARTINIHMTVVAKALRVAYRWKLIPALPFTHLEKLDEGPPRVRFLDSKTRARLLWAARTQSHGRFEDLVVFFLATGLRRNECKLLRWAAVNLEARSVFIENPKNGRPRHVPLPAIGLEILRRRMGARRLDVPFVFFNPTTGRPWDRLSQSIKRVLRRAGLSDWRLHDLRHAFATRLADNGASTTELMQILGHSSAVVVQRYAHVTPERSDRLMSAIDDDFRGWQQLEMRALKSR